ncbi:hypothetical protein ACIO93_39715 [Streptomyces sp. NPDC087903]|uniref:hypothetical protein n=1 Tax=Streptomyces sp. NPDC087903 TaxID=3365819 RepID=UPI0037FB3DDE
MPTAPSREEMLQAVEEKAARYGVHTSLSAPGAAYLVWQSVFECRVVRSIRSEEETAKRVKGRPKGIAGRPTYTDLAGHPVEPPADPANSGRVELVKDGSLGEEPCGDCVEGRRDCPVCEGQGGRKCARYVECETCHGGPDACWECNGTGHPRTRRARTAARPRPQGAEQRAACRRCKRADVACPTCLGQRERECMTCRAKGFVTCQTCKGAKRVRDEACGGTGLFTVWTEGAVIHTPDRDEVKRPAPLALKLRTDANGAWSRSRMTGVGEELPDYLEDAHRKEILPRLAAREREVRRHVTLRYLPLARVEVHADPDRVYYAFPGPAGIEVQGLPSKRRVAHLTALTSAALALVALVTVVAVFVVR